MARRALLLANATFLDARVPPLASPLADVARLKELLARPEVGGYDVKLCCDADSATARRVLQNFFDAAEHCDFLFVLISGHGLKDRWGKLHFATSDTVLDTLSATSLESRFVMERMDESSASHQVLFLDACYSGAFQKGTVNKAADVAVGRDDFGSSSEVGKAVITATTAVQLAGEARNGGDVQSHFTRLLFEGISTGLADRGSTGRISLADLYDHVRQGLKREAPGQTPQPYYYGLSSSVTIALNPCWRPAALPEDLLVKTASADRHSRGIAVEELMAIACAGGANADLAIAKLGELLDDDSMHVRTLAEHALGKIQGSNSSRSAQLSQGADDRQTADEVTGIGGTRLQRRHNGDFGPITLPSAQRARLSKKHIVSAFATMLMTVTGLVGWRYAWQTDIPAIAENQLGTTNVGPASDPQAGLPVGNTLSVPTPRPTPMPRSNVSPKVQVSKQMRAGLQIGGPYIIFFEWEHADLTPQAISALQGLLTRLPGKPSDSLAEITASVAIGDEQEAASLAHRRALAVQGYLVARGMPSSNIRVKTGRDTRARVKTADGVREIENRRVEIVIFAPA